MKSIALTNGRLVDPSQDLDRRMTLVIRHGRIAELTLAKDIRGVDVTIDVKECVVTPGFIDLHVHLREPGFEYKEDIESGARAAVAGGFTTICCMPNTHPVNDSAAVTEFIRARSLEVKGAQVLPIGAISRTQKGVELADIGDMARAGAVALSDDGHPVKDAGFLRRAMEYALPFGLPLALHEEDVSLHERGVMNEGIVATELGLRGIPHAAEDVMIARDIELSALTGCPIHICHVSTARSVDLIRKAKKEKILVTAEVTPHHLALTDESVRGYDPNFKMKPPLRTEQDRRALIRGLADGTIDAIATDHAPHHQVDKEVSFEDAAFGVVGLETALPVSLALVHERRFTLKRLVEAMSVRPAQIFNLRSKGSLRVGSDADVTVFDPKKNVLISPETFISKARNTPFAGWRLRGKVSMTVVAGVVCYPFNC